ncbi:MAG: hypothetical protein QOJ89_490, partial [bacterium]
MSVMGRRFLERPEAGGSAALGAMWSWALEALLVGGVLIGRLGCGEL